MHDINYVTSHQSYITKIIYMQRFYISFPDLHTYSMHLMFTFSNHKKKSDQKKNHENRCNHMTYCLDIETEIENWQVQCEETQRRKSRFINSCQKKSLWKDTSSGNIVKIICFTVDQYSECMASIVFTYQVTAHYMIP